MTDKRLLMLARKDQEQARGVLIDAFDMWVETSSEDDDPAPFEAFIEMGLDIDEESRSDRCMTLNAAGDQCIYNAEHVTKEPHRFKLTAPEMRRVAEVFKLELNREARVQV